VLILALVSLGTLICGAGFGWWLRGTSGSWCQQCGRPVGFLCPDCRRRKYTPPWAVQPTPQRLAADPAGRRWKASRE
jgi:hypothetical protein